MVSRSASRAARALPIRKIRKSRALDGHEEAHPTSNGAEENGTQANQVEDEEIAEDIKNTTSKLEKLKNPDAGLDQFSHSFPEMLAADKARIMVKLDEAKAAAGKCKKAHEEQNLELLGFALAPVVLDAAPTELSKPLHIAQVTEQGQHLHQQSMLLLEESKVLLETFNMLAERDPGASCLEKVAHEFNRNRTYTEKLFAMGRKYGKGAIEDMLADKYNEVRRQRTVSKDEEVMGKMVFDNADPRTEDVTMAMAECEGWGNVADKAIRAAQKMEAVTVRQ